LPSTVSRRIRYCRTIFDFAVSAALLSKNPFVGVKSSVEVNEERHVYVDRETIHKVMACCRDDHDRLLLALARFGGLRIPSEIRHMRYSDFTENVIRVHKNTKTGAREVPFFCEIRKIFDRIVAVQGKDFKPSALVFPKQGGFRKRIVVAIQASGVKQWAKLFVNLRSSCTTDLDERGYPEKTMDAIFGNSAVVRKRHYVKFRKEKQYAKVLSDDAVLYDSPCYSGVASVMDQLRDCIMNGSVTKTEFDEISVLMKMLLSRFGIDNKAV
jgi:site-specific recombinase XerC